VGEHDPRQLRAMLWRALRLGAASTELLRYGWISRQGTPPLFGVGLYVSFLCLCKLCFILSFLV
jgi:hypothetical protein